ncbi:hypothetical protein LOK49_LG15G02479 [Camellia lanceoleosa]|uniref:Uncharacterized protein n=1 Tax=Camellia lanceoleosa TaxID=1840588 RepID=A0ACC0F2V8_9ERIC|nr:hypothetical protein LOK49_LG15G02479 [Camellia lanceoleosa]
MLFDVKSKTCIEPYWVLLFTFVEYVAFSKGSGVQWSFSNKVSALPQFLSFNVGQEEKTTKPMSDPFASSGFKAISTADAFDTTHKRPSGEMLVWFYSFCLNKRFE